MLIKYKINSSIFANGATASTINVPITLDYQNVDNSELVERVFVDTEVIKSINPILDYEKVRFIPIHSYDTTHLTTITYALSFLNNGIIKSPTNYSDIGFSNDDLKFERVSFKESYLYLRFYDSDNALTQNLVNEIEIYSMLTQDDRQPKGVPDPIIAGQAKPSNEIPVRFLLSNPLTTKGVYEGYHIYNYKDEFIFNTPKYLYMRASYFNGNNGKITNLMVEPTAYKIDTLINKLYTRYKLYRDKTGFYYEIDDKYSTNVTYNVDKVIVNLYQIQAL